MSELQIIEFAVERAARRRRWGRALRGLWLGLLAGAIIWLVALAVFKLAPIPTSILLWAASVALVCPPAGFIIGGWRKPALPETARWVDVRQNLKERLSTALEVAGKQDGGMWRELVVNDAANQAKQLDPRRLVPFRLPGVTRWALLALALAAGLGFVPEYRSKKFLQQQADQKVIREVGRQIADLTRRSLEQRPPAMEPTQKALESVADVGDLLAKVSLTRSEALKDLASATDKLKDELKELGKDPGLRRLEQAARAPGGNSQTAEGLQKQMEALQNELGKQSGNPEAMDQLKNGLEKLQEAAKGLADKTGADRDAERQKLSEALSALSQQAQAMGAQLPQLDDAIAALAANQTDLFLKDLNAAMTDLDKLRDMAKTLQQLQAQAEKMGKDLAEQLKYGQAEAAQSTLQKMVAQLKAANLAPEQLQKMLAEVSKAVDPASQYGKVADFLKQATGQMQSGDKPGAAQSLAAAAKELEKMLQQLCDAQSLMASLDALKQAQFCIGNGECWGLRPGGNRPGSGRGGKPGSGVGTWADEKSGWGYDGQWTERWDNSGMVRPDQAPRGLTERDTALNDALTPTKVKGQFSPGGPMPSITLKGVSIKGQSKVAYEESVTAAQADAQSALSQEKVPRAYQGAVRDYFDDLKK